MQTTLIIVVIFFVAGALGCIAGARFISEFLHNYREYFIKRVEPGLKRSFIIADLKMLFFISLAITVVLATFAFFTLGVAGAVAGIITGLFLPSIALTWIKKRRSDQFIYQLPDALHALSSTLRSGVNLPKGLEQLASWQPVPLSQEFSLVLTEYQIGRELGEALDNMQDRINRPELELMNGAIKISRSVGGNLADTLESLAITLTEKLSVEGKIQALTAMGKLQGWVVSLVPVLMGVAIYILEPEKIEPLFTDIHGWITLGVIAIMMTMAIFMIRKIVDIDV